MGGPWEDYTSQGEIKSDTKPWEDFAALKDSSMSWGDVAKEAITNIPSSAVGYGKAMVQPFLHPVDTVNNIRDIAFGGLGKVIPGADVGNQNQKFDAFKQMIEQRYGGLENIKNTIATDPVGSLADVSTVLTGGGSLASRLPGMLGKAGEVANTVGRIAEPVNLAKNVVGRGMMAMVPDSVPLRLYESGIKPGAPTAKFDREQQLATLQAGLDAGITPNAKGVAKVDDIISGLNDQILGKIEAGTQAGKTIKTSDMVQRLDGVYDFFKRLPDSESYIASIDKIRDGMLSKGATLTLSEAQKTKQAIYSILKDSYGELSTATKEANKGIARGIKEEIVSIFPEIKSLNTQESFMLRLEPIIEKAAARINKRDLMGIGTPIAGAAAASMTTPGIGAAAMLTKAVLDHPSIKTYLAIALNKANKGGLGPGFVEQRLAAYVAGKYGNQDQNQQQPYANGEMQQPSQYNY